jgi:LmbE family N-acetylglucosaminyl deacetylase
MITDVSDLGTILGVWAHPDDEGWLMSGIMATAVRQGQKVSCITATRGEQGVQDEARWPAETLAQTRQEEMQEALGILGVTDHSWLGCADGGCQSSDQAAMVGRIAEVIRRVQPDSILTFGPEGLTGHPDHCCVSRWAGQALKQSGVAAKLYYYRLPDGWVEKYKTRTDKFNIFFAIDKPVTCPTSEMSIVIKLSPQIMKTKLKALAAHRSQTEGILRDLADILPESHGTETFCEAKL